jgi:NTP pyrophosphatase (non-canonical NTP hydrolase)
MIPENLTSMLSDVRRLRRRFAGTAPQPWTAATAAAELAVQLGHLALCLLRRRGADTTDIDDPQRPITDVGDELADVLLAVLSVTTLAGVEPALAAERRPARGDADSDGDGEVEVEAFLRLLVWAGQLAEAAMVGEGFRHQPAGTPPSIPAATGRAVADCNAVADHLGLDLLAEFRTMVNDAEAFLASREDAR